ncbi:hypothetical protein FE257_008011 [Aspergillus nanangensis]|uniref:Major facilitator superfamily (MFS) profile domain-containing protein n=1 Tax=Aspergillus nanangensis TaxID=2582783 RepID=A0AAD4GT04_ASPNN|nr:hypothetical protein FE257_008011 [Aspergillus nanangensis]
MEANTGSSGKQLLRKIDWHLLPVMVVSYMLQFLDKQTLNQASIMGILQDLKLSGTQYSWCGSIFYFGYLVFSYPASMGMVRLPIGKFIAVCFLIWGVILASHAATRNFIGIMVARFLLGAAEASVSPGFSLITGMWYLRDEQPLRHGLWFAGNSVATAFGGLIAYGVAHIQGSIAAWKWLFIIYGLITSVWAAVLVFFLPDSPMSARFLKKGERINAVERLRANQTGVKNNKIQWNQVWEALTDYKIWILFLYQLANCIPNGGFTTFTSLVMTGLGFSTLEVYLLSMPIGAVHAIFSIGSTYLATKYTNSRCTIAGFCTLVGLIGCVLVYSLDNQGGQLFGIFIFVAFAAGIPLSMSLVSSNVAGFTKKATVSSMMFIAYCTGNIIGPFLFFEDEAPVYQSGFLSIIICFAVAIVLIGCLGLSWWWENKRRDRLYGPPVVVEANSESEKGEVPTISDETDQENRNFRYVF